MPTTIVLVHGAWHGPWCFERVLPLLREAGVPTVAVELPSHGPNAGDLDDDVACVRRVLDDLGGDVLLLGHSYGGAVITETGTHPAVRRLVYLCAFALDDGESCAAAATTDPDTAAIDHTGRPDMAAGLVFHDDGTMELTPAAAHQTLYHDADDGTVAWALDRLQPQSIASLSASPKEQAWRTTPSTYVVCSDDQGVHPELQRIMARRCTDMMELPTGHSPFATEPEQVAALLGTIVAAMDAG